MRRPGLAAVLWLALVAPAAADAPVFPGLRALVIARGDCILAERYAHGLGPATRSPVYSVTKSVLSILVGMAFDDGALRPEETLGEVLPEMRAPGADPRLSQITIRDLLTMTGGFAREASSAPPGPAIADWLTGAAPSDAPGQRFQYGSRGPNLLSLALSRAEHMGSARFAEQRLFRPLGISNYAWRADGAGRLAGDTDLFLGARDMARFGLLWLRAGLWGRVRIVSASYVHEASAAQNRGGPPADAPYGYLWWIGPDGVFAFGDKGQLIFVAPARNLVVALAADAGDKKESLRFVREQALPWAATAPVASACAARLGPSP